MSSACLYFSFIQYPSPLLLAPSSSTSPHNSYFSIYCGDFSCSSSPRSHSLLTTIFLTFFSSAPFSLSHKYSTSNTISSTRQRETDACDELQSEKFITWICLWGHCSSQKSIWMEWSNFSTINYNLMTIKLNFPFLFSSLPSSSTHSISTWIALCLNINCFIVQPNENDDTWILHKPPRRSVISSNFIHSEMWPTIKQRRRNSLQAQRQETNQRKSHHR